MEIDESPDFLKVYRLVYLLKCQSPLIKLKIEVANLPLILYHINYQFCKLTFRFLFMQTSLAAKAPFDILASIFEICAEADWAAPLRLGGVCQSWRRVIHRTPRVWRVIDVGVRRKCRKLYFDKSGSYKLHLYMKDPYDIDEIEEVVDRIQCLSTPFFVQDMPEWIFSALTTLRCLDTEVGGELVDLGEITTLRFPNLRHLEIHHIYADPSYDDFPPLESLHLIVSEDNGWQDIASACSASLVSLQIKRIFPVLYFQNTDIILPRLRHLKIVKLWEEEMGLPLNINTPNLQFYIEDDEENPPEQLMHGHLSSATHMRLKAFHIPNHLATTLNAHVLQLELKFADFCDALDKLTKNSSIFPCLEHLEFRSGLMEEWEANEARRMLEEFVWESRPNMKLPTISDHWIKEFSVEQFTECGVRLDEWKHLYC